ncbi:MAG TPA: VIT family protein [Caldimonas sp.]|nr:VIT family protein [Caldimonas sp.]
MAQHKHRTHRSGWLRAGVLGANDGVLSIASLMLGIAAAHTSSSGVMVAGVAGLVAGALAMGAGEYVSVSSQADAERADLEIERRALQDDFETEHEELRDIYVRRGLDHGLATQVSRQLMAHDALGAHARDEIGITDALMARPLQAAFASALSFSVGGIVPLLAGLLAPSSVYLPTLAGVSLAFLAVLGALAARTGGASVLRGAARVLVWGAFAMGITAGVGAMFGASP